MYRYIAACIIIITTCMISAQIPVTPSPDTDAETSEKQTDKKDKQSDKFIPITKKVEAIELKNSDVVLYRTVNIGIGEVIVLEFPEGITLSGQPVIGDSALLNVEVDPSPLNLKVWAKTFSGTPENHMWGLNTNLQFKINAGITFIINFKIAPVKKASNRIIFSYPEFTQQHKDMQKQLVRLKNKLQKEHDKAMKKIDKTAEEKKLEFLTEEFGEFFMCNTYKARAEKEWVFLMSDRICKIGPKTILINFVVKNRYRQYFYLNDVKVYALRGSSRIELGRKYHVDKYGIQFDEALKGGIGFTVDDYARSYEIEIIEEAGKQRKIKLKVGF